MKGKRVLIVDDVISTGESLHALEALVNQAGGEIVGRMAILAEGEAQARTDLIYLEKLPVFNAKHSQFGSHEVFHLFVMAGSICHFVFMYQYVA